MFQKRFYLLGLPALALGALLFAAGSSWAGGHGGGGHGGGGHGGGGHGGGHGGGGHGGHGGHHDGHGHSSFGFGVSLGFGYPYYGYGYNGYGYNGYGYSSYYYPYSYPYYYGDYYYPPRPYNYYDAYPQQYAPYPPANNGVSQPPAPPAPAYSTNPNAVVFNVRVPPNAEMWFEGNKTSQTGGQRVFESPPLKPGVDYSYEVRAKWMENGRQKDETRKLTVRAGEQVAINFMPPAP